MHAANLAASAYWMVTGTTTVCHNLGGSAPARSRHRYVVSACRRAGVAFRAATAAQRKGQNGNHDEAEHGRNAPLPSRNREHGECERQRAPDQTRF